MYTRYQFSLLHDRKSSSHPDKKQNKQCCNKISCGLWQDSFFNIPNGFLIRVIWAEDRLELFCNIWKLPGIEKEESKGFFFLHEDVSHSIHWFIRSGYITVTSLSGSDTDSRMGDEVQVHGSKTPFLYSNGSTVAFKSSFSVLWFHQRHS